MKSLGKPISFQMEMLAGLGSTPVARKQVAERWSEVLCEDAVNDEIVGVVDAAEIEQDSIEDCFDVSGAFPVMVVDVVADQRQVGD